MVAKKSSGKKGSRVKVGKLKLSKETVQDLTKTEVKKVKGGNAVNLCKATATCGVHFPKTQI
jgi:hypothetical protein